MWRLSDGTTHRADENGDKTKGKTITCYFTKNCIILDLYLGLLSDFTLGAEAVLTSLTSRVGGGDINELDL